LISLKKKVADFSDEDSSYEEAATLLAKKFKRFLKIQQGSKNLQLNATEDDSQGATHGKREV
jgi:hypothetical protein